MWNACKMRHRQCSRETWSKKKFSDTARAMDTKYKWKDKRQTAKIGLAKSIWTEEANKVLTFRSKSLDFSIFFISVVAVVASFHSHEHKFDEQRKLSSSFIRFEFFVYASQLRLDWKPVKTYKLFDSIKLVACAQQQRRQPSELSNCTAWNIVYLVTSIHLVWHYFRFGELFSLLFSFFCVCVCCASNTFHSFRISIESIWMWIHFNTYIYNNQFE